MAPKREENTPVKLVKEALQDFGKAESPISTASATSRDSGAHTQPRQTGNSFQLPDEEFNFSGWRHATSALQQCHPDFSGCFTASIALHHWLSKQTDVPVKSSYHDYIGEGSTLRLAVQLNRRAWEGSVPSSLSLFELKQLI